MKARDWMDREHLNKFDSDHIVAYHEKLIKLNLDLIFFLLYSRVSAENQLWIAMIFTHQKEISAQNTY